MRLTLLFIYLVICILVAVICTPAKAQKHLNTENYTLKNPQWLCVKPAKLMTYCLYTMSVEEAEDPDVLVIDIRQEESNSWHTFVSSQMLAKDCWKASSKIFLLPIQKMPWLQRI